MGVQIKKIVPIQEVSLKHLKGKTISVDAMNTLYQFLSIIRQSDGTSLKDSQGRVTSHLSGLFYRTSNLIEIGIEPVFVFDGEPPEMKSDELGEPEGDQSRGRESKEESPRGGQGERGQKIRPEVGKNR